ncbi:MAG: ATP-binding protein [Polyangiales bacterium]
MSTTPEGSIATLDRCEIERRLERARAVASSLGALFLRTGFPVVALGKDGAIVAANDPLIAQYGWPLEALVTMRIHDFQASSRPIDAELDLAMRERDYSFAPRQHRRRDGSRLWVVPIAGPMEVDGEALIVSTLKDVTSVVESEVRARTQAEIGTRDRHLLDRAVAAMIAERTTTTVPLRTLARSLSEATGERTVIFLRTPELRRTLRVAASHGPAGDGDRSFDDATLDLDVEVFAARAWERRHALSIDHAEARVGSVEARMLDHVHAPMFVSPLFGSEGVYGLVYGVVRSVEDFERVLPLASVLGATAGAVLQRAELVEQARRDSLRAEVVWKAAVGRLPDAVTLFDHHHRLVRANETTCTFLGRSEAELIGETCRALFPSCRASVECAHERALRTGERSIFELTGGHNGRPLRIEIFRVEPAHPDIATINLAHDLTEDRAMRSQLLLNDRLATMGRLAASVAHEVNNPATYLSLSLGYLRRQLSAADPQLAPMLHQVDDAIAAVDQITQIVRDLTGVARERAKTVTDLVALVRSALRIADHELRTRVTVEIDAEAGTFANVRPARIAQVVLNLLLNAAQAVGDAGEGPRQVRVRVHRDDTTSFIQVADDGPGVPEALADRVFDPYFTTRAESGGTGLGLWLSRVSVEDDGGTLKLCPRTERGACFVVALPAYPIRTAD